jgi:hypothetical protein
VRLRVRTNKRVEVPSGREPTGEPDPRNLAVRFGGRGKAYFVPTPISAQGFNPGKPHNKRFALKLKGERCGCQWSSHLLPRKIRVRNWDAL